MSLEFAVCYGQCLCASNRPSIAAIVYCSFNIADRLHVLTHWPGGLNVLCSAGCDPEISLGIISEITISRQWLRDFDVMSHYRDESLQWRFLRYII